MLDHPSVDVMARTKQFTDRGFRLWCALETVMPPGITQPLALRAIRSVLPPSFCMRRGFAELEYHGWVRRRMAANQPQVDLLYRLEG
jgi:hypothetical protein